MYDERVTYICNKHQFRYIGLHTVLKVSDSIGIIKSIPILVSERQVNNTFSNTFHNDINKHKCYFDPKVKIILTKLMFCVCLITSF